MRTLSRIAPIVVLVVLAAVYLTPFIWMVSTSLKTQAQSIVSPPVLVPGPITIDAFPLAFVRMDFLRGLGNTLIYAVPSVIGTVVSCSLVAYGFALVNWRGRNVVFVIMLTTMMLPSQVTLIPLYVIYAKLGWINTYLPLVLPTFLGVPFFIFLLRQFFMGIPRELLDAARLDGASELRILTRIVAPLAAPALITVALLTFIDKWNDFYGPRSTSAGDRRCLCRSSSPPIRRTGPRRWPRRSSSRLRLCSSTSSHSASSSRESP